MKNNILFFFGLLSLLVLNSCSEEIKPSTDGKETAVVYAVISASDSLHYFKINRAFYGGGDAEQIALIPDSSYFKQVDATVKEYIGGFLNRTWVLKDTLIENKEPGVFYAPEQKVYYFKTTSGQPLLTQENVVYKFEANIDNGKFTVKGETEMVGDIVITSPMDNSSFNFASDDVIKYGYNTTNVIFNTGSSKKVEVDLTIQFEEYAGSNLLQTISVPWRIGQIEAEDIKSSMSSAAFGKTFYELIKQNATNDDNITKRLLKGINITVSGGSDHLQKYMIINKPSSSLAQTKPSYSNLTATNGMRVIGVFASRYKTSLYKQNWKQVGSVYYRCLSLTSTKELCHGAITGELFFCSNNPADNAQTYFCP